MAVWAFAQIRCGEDFRRRINPLGVGIVASVSCGNQKIEVQRLVPRAIRKARSQKTKMLYLEHELEFEGEQLAIGPHVLA